MYDFLMWLGGIVITVILSIGGGFLKMLFGKIKEIENKVELTEARLDAHKLYAAENFATKPDVEKGFDRVITHLDRIEAKVDRKADKKNV